MSGDFGSEAALGAWVTAGSGSLSAAGLLDPDVLAAACDNLRARNKLLYPLTCDDDTLRAAAPTRAQSETMCMGTSFSQRKPPMLRSKAYQLLFNQSKETDTVHNFATCKSEIIRNAHAISDIAKCCRPFFGRRSSALDAFDRLYIYILRSTELLKSAEHSAAKRFAISHISARVASLRELRAIKVHFTSPHFSLQSESVIVNLVFKPALEHIAAESCDREGQVLQHNCFAQARRECNAKTSYCCH